MSVLSSHQELLTHIAGEQPGGSCWEHKQGIAYVQQQLRGDCFRGLFASVKEGSKTMSSFAREKVMRQIATVCPQHAPGIRIPSITPAMKRRGRDHDIA